MLKYRGRERGRREMSTVNQWSSRVKEGGNKAFLTAKFFCLLHVSNTYFYTVALANGPSMLPTLNLSGDLVLADRLSVRFDKVRPGDIVLVRSPMNPRKIIVKRVVGMGGERVTFLVDPENSNRCETVFVPEGHVWIAGDNTRASSDSREFGAVPYGLLQGRVFVLEGFMFLAKNWIVVASKWIWPLQDFGSLRLRHD